MLTEELAEALVKWLRSAADCYRLKDWEIAVNVGEPDDDSLAETEFTGPYRRVVMRFQRWLFDEPEPIILRTLLHELTHLHHADLHQAVDDALDSVEPVAAEAVRRTMSRGVELLVDSIALHVATAEQWPSLAGVMQAARVDGEQMRANHLIVR